MNQQHNYFDMIYNNIFLRTKSELDIRKNHYDSIINILNNCKLPSKDLNFLPKRIREHYDNIFDKLNNIFIILDNILQSNNYLERQEMYNLCRKEIEEYLMKDNDRYIHIMSKNDLLEYYRKECNNT